MKNAVRALLFFLCLAGVTALVSMNVSEPAKATRRYADAWNKQAVDTAVARLRSGNIVLRMGLGASSRILSQINRRDKSYSHCGIVMIENGYPFVYHSIGGEDNPDERLRRDSACFFFSPLHNERIAIIIYDYSPAGVKELGNVVRTFYKARPKFDMQFDLATDDKLYCSEFVYKAIVKAMKDTAYLHTTLALGRSFVGIDDLFLNRHASTAYLVRFK